MADIEKYIRNKIKDENEVKRILYQLSYYMLLSSTPTDIKTRIDNNLIGWNDPCYQHHKNIVDERNEFIKNPFEVSEGLFKCRKCNCSNTFSYAKQTRSSDEAISVFITCANPKCGFSWKEG